MNYDLKVLKYKDLEDLMWLGPGSHLGEIVIDDASLEVMLRIEKTMRRLKVMGIDARRTLWIEIKAPGKRYQEETPDNAGNYWYQISSSHFKDIHYILIGNGRRRLIVLKNLTHVGGERKHHAWYGHVEKSLLKLEAYINKLVDRICENPDEYNRYVEQHLPFSKRKGRIKRSALNKICPEYRTFENPQHVVNVFKKYKALPMTSYKEMTLRTYMHIWRIAYVAYETKEIFFPKPLSKFENLSDEVFFETYNSKGRDIKGLDLDSEEDYVKWERRNSTFHCLDVAYARIHLAAVKDGTSWASDKVDVPEGYWYFSLYYSVYGYTQDVFNIIETLWQEGIRVMCDDAINRLIKMAEETDYVNIAPLLNYYHHDSKTGNEIEMPYDYDDISAQQIADIIAATKWKKQKTVRPKPIR